MVSNPFLQYLCYYDRQGNIREFSARFGLCPLCTLLHDIIVLEYHFVVSQYIATNHVRQRLKANNYTFDSRSIPSLIPQSPTPFQ
ncbi:hypothetical protein EYC84_005731 [Monilinia fructicola]|uniref:Uncharacterized protein n=1 Tax=Monilinia fructicola TaxID=38448 RepID=A0A5M9K266_MONFR|nr:hypothetical protein EYC84_005731 [Monilinia fructicola]